MIGGQTAVSARWPLRIGFASVFLLLGSLGVWSFGAQIAGAVVATGSVRVEINQQVVQHPDGGVVGAIFARDGDRVLAGDTVLRLDDTFLRAELAVVEGQLLEIAARAARLVAERDGASDMAPPETLALASLGADTVQRHIAGQERLFRARAISLSQEVEGLGEKRLQIEAQIDGTDVQIGAFQRQLVLVSKEAADLASLLQNGLVQVSRVLQLQREEARLQGEIGRLRSVIAEARGRIAGIEIEILKLGDRRREEAIAMLRDLRYSEIDLKARQMQLSERLARLDVRAPVDGIVFDSRVFAVQSVVQAAQPILFIVPGDQPFQVMARIDPVHIDQVFAGQSVSLRFTTFDQRVTPEIEGQVVRLSADVITDDATSAIFYEAIIAPNAASIAGAGGLELRPGMPVEAFLKTRDRSPMSYLTQPMTSYFSRAFREG